MLLGQCSIWNLVVLQFVYRTHKFVSFRLPVCSFCVFSRRFRRNTRLLQWLVFFVSSTRSVHFLYIMHYYLMYLYVLSASFSTHPIPLRWDKKPFQSFYSTLWDLPPFFGTVRRFKFLIFPRNFYGADLGCSRLLLHVLSNSFEPLFRCVYLLSVGGDFEIWYFNFCFFCHLLGFKITSSLDKMKCWLRHYLFWFANKKVACFLKSSNYQLIIIAKTTINYSV